jgi:hypothetical protein
MSCCCTNPYDLGCANPCNGITINYLAPSNGTYSLIANYLGGIVRVDSDILAGEPLVFDTIALNEFARYQFTVLLGGVALSFIDDDGNIFACFDVHFKPQGAIAQTVDLDLLT